MVLGAVIVLMPRAPRHRKMGRSRRPRTDGGSLTFFHFGPNSPGSQRHGRIKLPPLTAIETARITRLSADSRASPELWGTGTARSPLTWTANMDTGRKCAVTKGVS